MFVLFHHTILLYFIVPSCGVYLMFSSGRILCFFRRIHIPAHRKIHLSFVFDKLNNTKLVPTNLQSTCSNCLHPTVPSRPGAKKVTYRVEFQPLNVDIKGKFNLVPQFNWSRLYGILLSVLRPFCAILPRKLIVKMERSQRRPFDPPECVRGMKKLDKALFKTTAKILSVPVPVIGLSVFGKKLSKTLLKIPKIRPIAELSDDNPNKEKMKLILFDPEKYSDVSDFTEEQRTTMKKLEIDMEAFKPMDIDLEYDNWNAADILRAVLPTGSESVSGFSVIGHIAHLNIKENLLDYRFIIGEVILDKTKTVSTVVNKLNTIDNTYRNFQMELLAGEEKFVATTRENGSSFQLDFSKVYWNSRLGTEHKRISDLSPKGSVVYDVFAGVGPFAVPLAKRGRTVLANDLNPESFRWLQNNVQLNKCENYVQMFNMDGREFIKTVVKNDLIKRWKTSLEEEKNIETFVVMNLPALAIDFLDAFCGIGQDFHGKSSNEFLKMPTIFCYCFTKAEDPKADIAQRLTDSLGCCSEPDFSLFLVRNVAPNKDMYRVTFTLPKSTVFGGSLPSENEAVLDSDDPPAIKKQKTS